MEEKLSFEFSNIQKAYALYYNLMHDMWNAHSPEAHPSWKEAWSKQQRSLLDLIATMKDDEKKELFEKLQPHKPIIPAISRALATL